ncbi:MAG: hypothetical protein J2P41_16085 [Blastocatellia bacterium]|nr:hypothetical protein [Blastocatellia bacterium]
MTVTIIIKGYAGEEQFPVSSFQFPVGTNTGNWKRSFGHEYVVYEFSQKFRIFLFAHDRPIFFGELPFFASAGGEHVDRG